MGSERSEDYEGAELEVDLGDGKIARGHPVAIRAYMAAREAERTRNRRWPPDGSVDVHAAMTTLARLFPTLRDASGIDPFHLETFVRWLCSGVSGGTRRAGRFLLHVWNPNADHREVGRELGLENADDLLGAVQPERGSRRVGRGARAGVHHVGGSAVLALVGRRHGLPCSGWCARLYAPNHR